METTLFDLQNLNLRQRFHSAMDEPKNGRSVIFDGPINTERYLRSPIKVTWLLKEPYEGEDGLGGSWSFTDAFDIDDLYAVTFKKPHKATWHPIIYVMYGILNDFARWDDVPYIRDKPAMCDVVRSLAVVNVQKLPASGYTKTAFSTIEASYAKHNLLLHEQVDMLNADVHIFAGTFSLYRKKLGLMDIKPIERRSVDSYVKDGKIYLDAHHPAQRSVKRKIYVDEILEAVEEWNALR